MTTVYSKFPSTLRTNILTRNSAIADKPRDAFRGQSRSPNMIPFHVRYGFLLVCYTCSNFVRF